MSGGMSALEGCAITPQVSDESGERVCWPTAEDPERINTQGASVSTRLLDPSYDFNIERDTDGDIVSVLAKTPDNATQQGLNIGDSIYHRTVEERDRTHQQVVWRRYFIDNLSKTVHNQLEATVIYHPEATTHDTATELVDVESADAGDDCDTDIDTEGSHVMTVSVPRIAEELMASRQFADPPVSWYGHHQKWKFDGTAFSRFEERYIPVGSDYEPVESCSDLTFERISCDGARDIVDNFLNGDHTVAVEHNLGDTGAGWRAAFGVYHDAEGVDDRQLIGVLTLDEHPNAAYFEQHNELLISRIAFHPHRPKNAATWTIARARDWAAETGYDQIGSTAGVGANRGMIYKAAGFDLNRRISGWADGDGWTNREGRKAVRGGSRWFKRKYEYTL